MRFTNKTEYGIVCMAYMAKQPEGTSITVKDLAEKEHYPLPYTEKILQALRQAKLVKSFQGNRGGYALARRASTITLKEIVEALEGSTFEVFCEPEVRRDIVCTHFCLCGVKPVWRKTKELLDGFFESITLDQLAKNELEVTHSLETRTG